MNKEQKNALLQLPFEVYNLSPILDDYKVIGFSTSVFLKDEKSVDDFAKWFKEEVLKIKI